MAKKIKITSKAIDVQVKPGTDKRIAFFDTATKFGFAVSQPGQNIVSGVWNLKTHAKDNLGHRGIRLDQLLDELLTTYGPIDCCAYEYVLRHSSSHAAHSYGYLIGKVMEWAIRNNIQCSSVHWTHIKQEATGKGGGPQADKNAMCRAAKARWPAVFTVAATEIDDNEADARFGLVCLAKELGVPLL